ncbi:MAG: TlpA family protein disulfide reductase [Chloroflexi bacterium]|nr:TlpA family protein disulfide reductase [Chloroflexota bacterium]
MTTLTINANAPAFSLKGLDDKSYTLYKDPALITAIVFFKTTCPTCQLAWKYIERLHQAYQKAGFAVWGISQHDAKRSAEFASNNGSTFPILIDANWHVSKLYDPDFVPTLFLIESTGKIIDRVVAFDKAGFNRVAQTIAARLDVVVETVAPENDGAPPFKPG